MHGWGGSINSFAACAEKLSSSYRVTLLDFFGFGLTPHPNYALELSDYADSVLQLIKHYQMQEVTLIAHSFGARVAIKLAYDFPNLIEKMVLVNGAGIRARKGVRYYCRHFRHKLLTALHIPHKAGSSDYRSLSPVMKGTFVKIINQDLAPLLPKINIPALLIWGAKDRQTPLYMARRMSRLLPENKLIILKKAAHFSYLDQPALFYQAVFYFLQGVSL